MTAFTYGVGKTHLPVGLEIKACEQGVRTLFITATELTTSLGRALAERWLDERLKILTQPQLLIVDQIDRELDDIVDGAKLAFCALAQVHHAHCRNCSNDRRCGADRAGSVHDAWVKKCSEEQHG